MIQIQLEGDKITNEQLFHELLAKKMHFPDYYGKNLDALEECLTDFLISYPNEDILIEWTHHEESKKNIGKERFEKILEVIEQCRTEWKPDLQITLC